MYHKIAEILRRWAQRLDPVYVPHMTISYTSMPQEIAVLMFRARELTQALKAQNTPGSIKHLMVAKAMQKEFKARRRDINMAVERAVAELGD